jgi:EAL domain-containing protein (putative c-di-GMP-specific phosphodiesterase class I)
MFADSALFKAKDEGKNNYQFYSSDLTVAAFEKVIVETNLRTAIKNNEFIIYYQAQTDGRNDNLVGVEALVRWNSPYMGLVPPSKFIPIAEESGLIVELDRYVMKQAMSDIVKWYKEGLNPGVLALNLSMKQLRTDDFIEFLKTTINELDFKVEWLELEITESQMMKNPIESIKKLKQISELGIEIAIDDFGTGYSSLAYLKKLPVNKLKIDQSFIRELPYNEDDSGISKAVIALSKSLNLNVIAEGVETQEQKEFLVENGCYNIQGYYYSCPISVAQMTSYLKK